MKILDTQSNQLIANNSLLRGEQVFTSLLFFNGKLLFFDQHIARLIKGASFLFPQHNWSDHIGKIKDYVLNQVAKLNDNSYCRLTIVDDTFFMISNDHLTSDMEVKISKSFQIKTPSLRPSYLKLSQYADSFLELRKANEIYASDVIYFDHNNFLTEASTSNVFILNKNGKLITPYLSSMVLDGILRSKLCKKFEILEGNITEEDLFSAKEIWLTNSIKGLRFVHEYQGSCKTQLDSLFDNIVEKIGRYGEKFHE